MLILATTTDSLEIITSATCDIDYYTSYMDCTQASPPVVSQPERTSGNITTATTTANVIAAPGGTLRRNVKLVVIRNAHASSAVDVTVQIDVSGTKREMIKTSLLAGETLEYTETTGWFKIGVATTNPVVYNFSTADQGAGFASDTYLTGSNLLIGGRIKVGTLLEWEVTCTKTAAGTATPIFIVRFGTAGAIGDTARCTLTAPAATAAADTGIWVVRSIVRTHSSTGVVASSLGLMHALDSTGFSTGNGGAQATSGSFDTTVSGLQAGVSLNGGTSASWTVQMVRAMAHNLSA